jgi:hypothetical protein
MGMKKRHLFYIAALAVMLSLMFVGSVLTSQACERKKAFVEFYPDRYVVGETPPDTWLAYISLGFWHSQQINTSSILLEGVLAPENTSNFWFVCIAYFNGTAVASILVAQLSHVALGWFSVSLTVSGKLIDGRPFYGIGIIKVVVPSSE